MSGGPGSPGEHPGRAGAEGPAPGAADRGQVRPVQLGFERFLSFTRLLALIPVLFLLVDAAASFIYGTDILVRAATGLIGEPAQVGGRLGLFLIVMDTFLVGATLMVSAFGFYELFVVKTSGDRYWLPAWLRMRDLEDLKARVVSMLILVVAITFVDRTVESHDEQEVLFLGLGISIIIVALTFFLWFGKRTGASPDPDLTVATSGGAGGGGGGTPAGGTAPSGGAAGRGPSAGRPIEARAAVSSARPALRLATADLATAADATAADGAAGNPEGPMCSDGRPARLIAILGVARRAGGQAMTAATALAVAGFARFDLSEADLAGPEIRIRAIAVFGVVSIIVPPGTQVIESGVVVLGLRLTRGTATRRDESGAPILIRSEGGHYWTRHRLILSGFCTLGVVRVRVRQVLSQPSVAPGTTRRPMTALTRPLISVPGPGSPPAARAADESSRP